MFTENTVKVSGTQVNDEVADGVRDTLAERKLEAYAKNRLAVAKLLMRGLRFVNKNGQPLHMMPMLEPYPELLEQPLYH